MTTPTAPADPARRRRIRLTVGLLLACALLSYGAFFYSMTHQ